MNEKAMLEYLTKKYPDLEKSPNDTDGYDCMSVVSKLYMELKSRRTHYDTLILEQKKYEFLTSKAKQLGFKPLYINWTPKGMWCFELDSNPNSYIWEEQWLPASTDFARKSKITKSVTLLDIKNGKKIL